MSRHEGLTRRLLLGGALAGATAATLPFAPAVRAADDGLSGLPARPPTSGPERTHRLTLVAAERDAHILGPGRPASRVWSFARQGEPIFPILRAQVGDRISARLENRLPQHTSIHWHGVRVPNGMDGVPYVTQPPVQPGETFEYGIPLEDTGTYFLHPHCDESGQTGRGLMAILVVEGDAPPGYADSDLVLAVKDWRLADDGTYLPFDTKDGAGRAGTFGTVRGTNGQAGPMRAAVPTGGIVRLRVLNLDPTRILQLGVEGAAAALIATDGHALQPVSLDGLTDGVWRLGPAMRADLLVQAPARAGETLRIMDYGSAEPWLAAELTAAGPRIRQDAFEPRPLYAAQIPRVTDLGAAERLSFTFGASSGADAAAEIAAGLPAGDPLAKVLLDTLCVRDTSLWAINKTPWPAGPNAVLPPPLGTLAAGRPYIAEWINTTPHPHPIHLHGHTFEVLSYSRQAGMPRHLADTVIINPRERVEVAFLAAPGDWMLHCHIVEHLEYGMMGYLRVA
ncbi:multicopper oxidase family protein [Enterovirga aerilata]|uniref:Multicopper oxidase family protein n=1 Tax=Enterovirga aerilata TaxID=2730920 RepID=A0A849I6R2_9HYPH|nr:multicopper oxidase family protein [Enterovirga sp. DB1703]NNM73404.1 multicopper oxidase family protein [Enterovirga sp. DB1703]